MNYAQAFILGIVQGLTEFLPISSSGHLVLVENLLNIDNQANLLFEIFLHLGSLFAVILFFRKNIIKLIQSLIFFNDKKRNKDRLTVLYILFATLITGLIGLIFSNFFEDIFNNIILIPFTLSITGLLVFMSDKFNSQNKKLNLKNSGLIGLGQAIAIIPGISRSGSTIFVGLLLGLKRSKAATFSFLLSIPIIIAVNLSKLNLFFKLEKSELSVYFIGFLSAFLSGYLVITWLMKLIKKAKLKYFAFYCWFLSFFIAIHLIFK